MRRPGTPVLPLPVAVTTIDSVSVMGAAGAAGVVCANAATDERRRKGNTRTGKRSGLSMSPPLASFAPARPQARLGTSQCPGFLTRGSQQAALPSHSRQGRSGVCEPPLPAYSGVTAWAFNPLRLVTGETSVVAREYSNWSMVNGQRRSATVSCLAVLR